MSTEKDVFAFDPEGFVDYRVLPDERILTVAKIAFERARLGISFFPPHHLGAANADTWEYPSVDVALVAMREWDPTKDAEPDGWDRHGDTARRRPGGDPSKEEIQE